MGVAVESPSIETVLNASQHTMWVRELRRKAKEDKRQIEVVQESQFKTSGAWLVETNHSCNYRVREDIVLVQGVCEVTVIGCNYPPCEYREYIHHR